MQEFFTQATIAVEVFGFGYIASSFALYARRRLHDDIPRWRPQSPVPKEQRVISKAPAPPAKPARKLSPTEELRQQCQQAGIKWRHAHGKNKHLKKAEMIAALAALKPPEPVKKPAPKVAPVAPRRKAA